jgi:DNA-binding transcriptional LysR family regulator
MAQSMADTATAIDRRGAAFGEEAGGLVRVAGHEWAARFLAPRLAALAEAQPDLTVELAETHLEPDLGRREADLFIRHGLPSRGQLIRVALGTMATAVYGTAELAAAHATARTDARWRDCPWVAYDTPHEYFLSMSWLAERVGDRRPRVRANRVALQLEASGPAPASDCCRVSSAMPSRRWSDSRRPSPTWPSTAGCSTTRISGRSDGSGASASGSAPPSRGPVRAAGTA